MKITELRIGNWVNTKFYKDFKIVGLTVFEDKTAQCTIFKDLNYYPQSTKIEDLRGIKLNDEWIKSFGGVDSIIKLSNYLSIELNKDKYYNAFIRQENNDSSVDCILLEDIKYVHQLQNLCYAITGKELIARTQNK